MKYNAGGNTPRTIDPTLTRKRGALSHPGSLLLVVVALIFFAYMFGLLPQLDTYFNALTHSIDNQRDTAMTIWQYAPIVAGGIVILILSARRLTLCG
jgi:type II secretory pathway component PulF